MSAWYGPTAALIGAFLGTVLVRRVALAWGVVNAPNPIVPQHTRPVAYLGGIGVLIGLLAGFALAAPRDQPEVVIWLPAILFTMLGLADDLLTLKPFPKLLLQCVLGLVAVTLGLGNQLTPWPMLSGALALLWIVTLVNAFNLTDVCDGLLASVCAATFLAWAAFAHAWVLPVVILTAAFCGFLPFNLPRASIFLGDAGSHLGGFLVAALGLSASANLRFDQMLLIAAVPVFELVFLVFVRTRKRLPWWRGSPDHFSLRLQASGWSRWSIDGLAALCAFVCAAAGMMSVTWPAWAGWLTLVVVSAISMAAGGYLLRLETKRG